MPVNTKTNINPETILEALIFAAPEPVQEVKLAKVAGMQKEQVAGVISELNEIYNQNGRSFEIRHIGNGYSFYVKPDFAPWITELFGADKGVHLTRPMFEVLAIIAVKQPITKPIVDKIRSVNSSAPLTQLLKLGLITISGRHSGPGKPFLYVTTKKFLKSFGLNSPEEIPTFEELQKMFESSED